MTTIPGHLVADSATNWVNYAGNEGRWLMSRGLHLQSTDDSRSE